MDLKKFYLIFFFLCSCDGILVSEKTQSLKKDNFRSNSSAVYFTSQLPLAGVLSEEYYWIKAHFPHKHSQLELFSHFQSFEVEDGVRIVFKRHEAGLSISLSVQGYKEQTLFEDQSYFSSSQTADWTVAVKNGTDYGFRVRIWENFINKNKVLKKQVEFLTAENLLIDSEPDFIFYTKGQGLKWGLKLFQTRLLHGARVSPRVL